MQCFQNPRLRFKINPTFLYVVPVLTNDQIFEIAMLFPFTKTIWQFVCESHLQI